jgi:hypothetical protein
LPTKRPPITGIMCGFGWHLGEALKVDFQGETESQPGEV